MRADRLRELLAEVGGPNLTAVELAEVVWLAARAGPYHHPSGSRVEEPDGVGVEDDSDLLADVGGPAEPVGISGLEEMTPAPEPQDEPVQDADDLTLHAEAGDDVATAAGSFLKITVPAASTLHDRLGLQRAMRPLKRRVPSPHLRILDETTTAERMADDLLREVGPGRFGPSMRPAEERWLQLDLVFDASPSMAVWRDHLIELEYLMSQVGAFSTVRCWSLHLVADAVSLRPFGQRVGGRAPSVVYGVSGRQAILVMSDCSGAGWWRGTIGQVVAEWGRRAPVAVVQPLPERLWARTAAPASPGTVRVAEPGLPNTRMRFTPADDFRAAARDGIPVPILELSAPWLAGWASTVAGISSHKFPTAVAHLGGKPAARPLLASSGSELTAAERVLRFRSSASPEAFRLAGYTATTVPTVAVMRLVQQAMFRRSDPAQLAEVILSGLFRTDYAETASFTFVEGTQELMLSTLTRSDTLAAVHVLQRVSELIESRAGESSRSMRALLALPTSSDGVVDRGGASFALVSPKALARLAPQAGPTRAPTMPTTSVTTPYRAAPVRRRSDWAASPSAPSVAVLNQPMLFVGLGGTGCRVGAEFEKRLREELCGPDGTALQARFADKRLLPFELPSCTQFVYADLSASELQRVRREAVPGPEHDQAAQRTMRLITDLVPAGLVSSTDVAQSLRINLDEYTVGWLPAKGSDPRVGPLVRGAGQLPTVGRAVLFETVRRNPDLALSAVKEAMVAINQSAGHLYTVSGGRSRRVDPVTVFVAFSVAGGTGSGLYYDYLHLIGNLMAKGGLQAQIYPLVLMPSAFDDGQGGGRPAELNAGAALIDLFRLIDDQNAQFRPDVLDASDFRGAVSVRYPRIEQVSMRPGMIPTAFLFGRPVVGMRRDDLHRSMAALMSSLVGVGLVDEDGEAPNVAGERAARAQTGVGRRGVTTSAVAALTVPLGEITDILSDHLFANAVTALLEPPVIEENRSEIRTFIARAGLDLLLEARLERLPPLSGVAGYVQVMAALTNRANAMTEIVERARKTVPAALEALAGDFDPVAATTVLLYDVDFFRMQRVVLGQPELADPVGRGGFWQLLEGWQLPPRPPANLSAAPPLPESLPRKLFGRARIADPQAQVIVRRQDAWFAWQARRLYNDAWKASGRIWTRTWQRHVAELRALHDQFLTHVTTDREQFDVRLRGLFTPRAGVVSLLPPQTGLYQRVLDGLKEQHASRLPSNPNEGHLLNVFLGPDGWPAVYERGRRDPAAALGEVRQRIRQAVVEQLRPPGGDRPSLIPRMEDLLASAALRRAPHVAEDDLHRFRLKLAELIPGGFTPDGPTPIQVLITYPALERDLDIERFLRHEVPLPVDVLGEPRFQASRADALTVTLLRTSMGVIEVPELRRTAKVWSDAHRSEPQHDSLAWRRRLRPEPGYQILSADDRRHVLHHLLCAAWDGYVKVDGDLSSPDSLIVGIGSREAIAMRLNLESVGVLSSWASVLQAYEEWIVADDDRIRHAVAASLMTYVPRDADRAPLPPSPVFTTLVELAGPEAEKLQQTEQNVVLRPRTPVIREFWLELMPAALSMPVGSTSRGLLDLLPGRPANDLGIN